MTRLFALTQQFNRNKRRLKTRGTAIRLLASSHKLRRVQPLVRPLDHKSGSQTTETR
jgi:hypothetical protein